MISKLFRTAVKISEMRAYQIAHKAGLHPSTLSQIICGIEKVKDGDSRVLKIGKVLGLKPEECFENSGEKAA